MQIVGLSKDVRVQHYLKSIYGLEMFEFAGLPAYKKGEEFFLGGFKGYYAVLIDEDASEMMRLVNNFFSTHKESTCSFSVSDKNTSGSLGHYLLSLPKNISPEARFDHYNKKTRNQVRKSYQNDLRVHVGTPPVGFYELYVANIRRLGGIPKSEEHFVRLGKFLEDSVVCFSAYDGDVLVGCNYAILSDDYATLVLNISDKKYWSSNINDRLYDEFITWAIGKGVRFVDFGPGVFEDESHNHFKEGFGAVRRTIINKKQINILKRVRLFVAEKARNLRLRFSKLMV